MRVEECWSSWWWACCITNWNIIDCWILMSKIFAVKSWFLWIVFISNNEKLLSQSLWEFISAEKCMHNIVETFSWILTRTKHVSDLWNLNTKYNTGHKESSKHSPFKWSVLMICSFCVRQRCNGISNMIIESIFQHCVKINTLKPTWQAALILLAQQLIVITLQKRFANLFF